MSVYPLLEYVTATADAQGRSEAVTGPYRYGETWVVKLVSTSSTSVAETQLRVYRGVESDSALVLSTYSGNSDTAGGSEIRLPAGDKLVFVWTAADAGSQCTARIEGDIESRRR